MKIPVTTAETIAHLDFNPEIPCEHSAHGRHPNHDGPARFLIESHCPGCGDVDRFYLCEPGWKNAKTLSCADCGGGSFPRDECWRIVSVLGGAS